MKHTPGPWKVGNIHGKRIRELWIHAEKQTCPVAYVNITKMEKNENVWANAHLISAAPDLLEALTEATRVLISCNKGGCEPGELGLETFAIEQSLKAITKAEPK